MGNDNTTMAIPETPPDPDAPRDESKSIVRQYVSVLVVALALYGLTTQRGYGWQDSGVFQWRILNFDLLGWNGIAVAHPLLIILGKVFSFLPLGPLALRINLLSAVAGAVAVANVATMVRRL